MRSHATRRLAPHWIFWPALGACGALVLYALQAWTWLEWPSGEPGPVAGPPSGVGLASAPAIVFVASLAVCVFAIARWDRAAERRHELLALVALGLLGLGQLLIVQAALAGTRAGAAFPGLPAVAQARWVLAAAALVGAVALVRIARSRPRNRGAIFALAALIGAPCTLPILGLMEAEPFEPRIDAELELAGSSHAYIARPDPSEPSSPVLDVLANGEFRLARSSAEAPVRLEAEAVREALQRFIAPLPQRDGAPDVALILRIDRAAEFRHVSAALRIAGAVGLWRVCLAVARTGHDVPGLLLLHLPLDLDSTTALDASRTLRLREKDGQLRIEWNDELLDLQTAVARTRELTEPLSLVPDEDVPWEWIVQALPELAESVVALEASATEFTLRTHR